MDIQLFVSIICDMQIVFECLMPRFSLASWLKYETQSWIIDSQCKRNGNHLKRMVLTRLDPIITFRKFLCLFFCNSLGINSFSSLFSAEKRTVNFVYRLFNVTILVQDKIWNHLIILVYVKENMEQKQWNLGIIFILRLFMFNLLFVSLSVGLELQRTFSFEKFWVTEDKWKNILNG